MNRRRNTRSRLPRLKVKTDLPETSASGGGPGPNTTASRSQTPRNAFNVSPTVRRSPASASHNAGRKKSVTFSLPSRSSITTSSSKGRPSPGTSPGASGRDGSSNTTTPTSPFSPKEWRIMNLTSPQTSEKGHVDKSRWEAKSPMSSNLDAVSKQATVPPNRDAETASSPGIHGHSDEGQGKGKGKGKDSDNTPTCDTTVSDAEDDSDED